MSGLENLTAKILADSKAAAQEVIDAAKLEAENKIAEEIRAATAESEKIVADAHIEAKANAEQIIQGKALAIRDENLGAKRQVLDKIFTEALKRLNEMPKDEYLKYLGDYLSKLELDGEELVLPKRYGIKSVDEIMHVNKLAELFGKGPRVKLSTNEAHNIDGGFVLVKNGVEHNHTFDALLGYYRYELESEVLKILYS